MEQLNVLTQTVRKIRRFGMEFEGEKFDPHLVGQLHAADGRPIQT